MKLMNQIQQTKLPINLKSWQKKYGLGFVLYSLKTGKPLLNDQDYEKLIKKSKTKAINREETSVVYVPSLKQISVF